METDFNTPRDGRAMRWAWAFAWIGLVACAAPLPAGFGQPLPPAGMGGDGDGPPITTTCIGLQAPAAIHVAAGTAADGMMARSPLPDRYDWDFGDPAGRWNRLPGWNAAHVYDRPGVYQITLTATGPDGKATRRTVQIRIAPPDRRRIFVAAGGNDQAGGGSPAQAVRTAARAFQLAKAGNAAVFFRRGDVFDVASSLGVNGQNVYVTSYDPRTPDGRLAPGEPPPLPVLRKVEGPPKETSLFFVGSKARDVVFDGVEFDSQWPLTSEFGSKKIPARALTVGGNNVTVRNCSFRNVTDAVNTELKPIGVLLQDNVFSDEIRGYCYWGNGRDHVLVGNVMTHSRQEHQIRCSEPGITRLLVAYNDLSRPNDNKGGIELREAHWFYVADNHLDGGTMRVGPQDDALVKTQIKNWESIKCTWGVIQDNRFDRIWVHVRLGSEHVMVRNNTVRLDDGEWAFLVACDKPGFNEVRKLVDVTIEQNTAINNGTRGQFMFVQGRPAGLTVRKNLYIAPRVRQAGGKGGAVYATDPDLAGIDAVEGNVYPAGPGGTHHAGPVDVAPADWANRPRVKDERYEDVTVDEDDNPPPRLGVGAKLGQDKRERDAKRAADGKLPGDYRPPSPAPPVPVKP